MLSRLSRLALVLQIKEDKLFDFAQRCCLQQLRLRGFDGSEEFSWSGPVLQLGLLYRTHIGLGSSTQSRFSSLPCGKTYRFPSECAFFFPRYGVRGKRTDPLAER